MLGNSSAEGAWVQFKFTAAAAFGAWLAATGSGHAATISEAPLEMTPQIRSQLREAACSTDIESIDAWYRLDPPATQRVEIQCKPHTEDRGRPLATFVRCQRASATSTWSCGNPVPTVTVDFHGRQTLMRLEFVAAQDAVEAVSYLLSAPSMGKIKVSPHWIASRVNVYRSGQNLSVSGGKYIFGLTLAESNGSNRLQLTQILKCSTDTCSPLAETMQQR